jgi:hypothetical protein
MRMRASRAKVAALHEMETTSGRVEAASARTCSIAPARGGSIDRRVERREFVGSQRTAEEIARLSLAIWCRPGVVAAARASAA